MSALSKCHDGTMQPILRIWSESGMRFARILCRSGCRVARRRACKREWHAQPLHWTRSWQIKKKKLRDRSLLSQSALILELWMVFGTADCSNKKYICAQAIMHNLYACLFLRMLSHNQAEYKYLHISSERRYNWSIILTLIANTCSKCQSSYNFERIVRQVSCKCLVHWRKFSGNDR